MSLLTQKIVQALAAGERGRRIAERLGCSESFVSHIKRFGSADERNRYMRALRAQNPKPRGRRCILSDDQRRIIIAAVDDGKSYAEVARLYGLKSRNVVAGIVNRRPESRA